MCTWKQLTKASHAIKGCLGLQWKYLLTRTWEHTPWYIWLKGKPFLLSRTFLSLGRGTKSTITSSVKKNKPHTRSFATLNSFLPPSQPRKLHAQQSSSPKGQEVKCATGQLCQRHKTKKKFKGKKSIMSTNIPNSQNSTWGMGFDLRQGEHDYTNVSLILNPGISPPKVGTTLNRCPRVSYEPYYGKKWWVGAILIHFKLKDWSPWLYWGNFTLSLHKIKPFGSQFPRFGKMGKKNLINTKNACTWSFQTGNGDKEHLIQEIK